MVDTKAFYDALATRGMDFFAGVPDSLLSNFCAYVQENAPPHNNIITANEGSAVGMACGYHLASGKYGVVYMQNSGQGNAVNPLLSIADDHVYGIPMLLIIGWRGEPNVHDEPQHVKQGKVTLALLEAIDIPYRVLEDDFTAQLDELTVIMHTQNRPVALVVRKDAFSSYKMSLPKQAFDLTREQALETILSCLNRDDMVVSTTGKTSREVFELREKRGQGHDNDFLTVGGMGHTSSIAFGMAIGTDKNVYCIDGDGSFLMHMGALAPIMQNVPSNFKYILNNNGAHESVGGQPTVAMQIDIEKILYAFGFENVITASTQEKLLCAMGTLTHNQKTAIVLLTRQGSRSDLGRPTVSVKDNKSAIMKKLCCQ